MSSTILLESLGFGVLARPGVALPFEARLLGVVDPALISPAVGSYLRQHIANLVGRSEDVGLAQPGWWIGDGPPAEMVRFSQGGDGNIAAGMDGLLRRLIREVHPNASGGLLVFARFSAPSPAFAILKLNLEGRDLYRFAATPQVEEIITHQRLDDLLPEAGDLKKAALIPNPSGNGADARVIDFETKESAQYWLAFLGLRTLPLAPTIVRAIMDQTFAAVAGHVGETQAREHLGRVLREVAVSSAPLAASVLVERVATSCGLNGPMVWSEVLAAAPKDIPEEATITAAMLDRLQLEIQVRVGGARVTVRGPAAALEGHFSLSGAQLRLDVEGQPSIRRVLKPGFADVD